MKQIRGPRRAWQLVRAHARMHKTGDVSKRTLTDLVAVARCNGANHPAAMAVAARRVWP